MVGENGAGKSSLVSVVEYALFGDPHLKQQVARGADTLTLECWFEASDAVYAVRRRAGGKPSLEIERVAPTSENLSQSTIADTQSVIDRLLGLTRETFRASAYLAQGDGAAFTEARPGERKAVLAEILGLRIWGWLEDRAKADHKTLAAAAEREHGRLEQLRRELEDLPERRDALLGGRAALATANEQLALAEMAVAALEARERAAAAAREAREALRHVERSHDSASHALAVLTRKLDEFPPPADLKREADRIPALEAKVAAAREALERWQEQAAQQRSDERRLAEVEALLAKRPTDPEACPTCGQPITTTGAIYHYGVERERLTAEFDMLQERPVLGERPVVDEAELNRARDTANALGFIESGHAEATRLDEQLAEMQARIDELTPRAAGADVNDQGERKALAAQRAVKDAAQRVVDRAEADVERLGMTELTLQGAQAEQAERQRRLDLLSLLVRAYGRDGVPAMITEHVALPQIEAEAGRILADLGTDFSIELRTQRAVKTGQPRDALDIIVRSGPDEAPYESFSGGERTRVNLALRIALARLLATRRGAQVRCLLIDEPEFLDAAGMERLAAVLQSLRSDFDRILVVSHHDSLRTGFDSVLSVQRNGAGSHIA